MPIFKNGGWAYRKHGPAIWCVNGKRVIERKNKMFKSGDTVRVIGRDVLHVPEMGKYIGQTGQVVEVNEITDFFTVCRVRFPDGGCHYYKYTTLEHEFSYSKVPPSKEGWFVAWDGASLCLVECFEDGFWLDNTIYYYDDTDVAHWLWWPAEIEMPPLPPKLGQG